MIFQKIARRLDVARLPEALRFVAHLLANVQRTRPVGPLDDALLSCWSFHTGVLSGAVEDGETSVRPGDRVIGKYLVERVLGEGGMGVVVAAHHETLNQKVAIKFLLPAALGDQNATERFVREARAAAQIQSEHVARVTDVGLLDNGAPYMVMEYLEGHDLADELKQRGALPPEEAADYILQALEALSEAHATNIIHRDLKPANIFLAKRKDGSRLVKVLDFGISKALSAGDASLTATSALMGSPLYMAPEQIRDAKSVDVRADIWSLGVILYECLSGDVPFGGDTLSGLLAQIVADPPPPLGSVRPDLPPTITSIVDRCLEKNREMRVQDVAELARLLSPIAPPTSTRSIERIHSTLGVHWDPTVKNTNSSGTPAAAMDRTQMAPGGVTLPGGMGEMTERPVTQDGTIVVPKARFPLMPIVAVAAAVLAALMAFAALRPSAEEADASAATEDDVEPPELAAQSVEAEEQKAPEPEPAEAPPQPAAAPAQPTPAPQPAVAKPVAATPPAARPAPPPAPVQAPPAPKKPAPVAQPKPAPAPVPAPSPSAEVGDPLLGRH